MDSEKKILRVDIEKIIGEKNPGLLKLLPRFILNYIKKIIHQDEVNIFLQKHVNDYGLDFAKAVVNEFEVNITSEGLQHIPKSGGCVIAANHPLGGLDALPLMIEMSKVRSDMKFLVNDILMVLENLGSLFVPINKHGKNATENIQRISNTYSSDNCTLIFPAGLVSRKQKGVIKDLDWHKSFITQSVKHKRNIIPVYIDARNSNFFYNLGLWRKRMGIQSNIEMFYLVNEMYKQRNRNINIIFGEAISYTTFSKEHSDRHWARAVKEHVYGLPTGRKHLPVLSV
ncbi:MAG: 1-acyl-sn-glycerol-3-phosphate acyltransferase [Bacteroidia bacterium]|nr:1-acyl-sn-glycerol-3-phosphate acyltransferase [Bacteroidia bacterium]